MKKEANYFVWRRNDGFVGCTRYKPGDRQNWTFKHIAEVETWAEARPIIEANRDEKHHAVVQSWKERDDG